MHHQEPRCSVIHWADAFKSDIMHFSAVLLEGFYCDLCIPYCFIVLNYLLCLLPLEVDEWQFFSSWNGGWHVHLISFTQSIEGGKKCCCGLQTPASDKLLQIPFGAINNHGCNFSSSQVRGNILNELVQWVVRNSLTHLMHFSSLFYSIICQERAQH